MVPVITITKERPAVFDGEVVELVRRCPAFKQTRACGRVVRRRVLFRVGLVREVRPDLLAAKNRDVDCDSR